MPRNDDYPDHQISLGLLKGSPPASSGISTTPTEVPAGHPPLPPRKWKSRIVAPLILLALFGSLLGWATWDVIFPGREVEVVPVVVKSIGLASPATPVSPAAPGAKEPAPQPAVFGGQLAAQGSGWVEPDPFEEYTTALASGIISEILVLDGETVLPNQVVARMVSDDADIAVAEAEANRANAQADLASAKVQLQAAQREWDNPIQQERKLETTQAALAETSAERKQLPALIKAEDSLCKQLQDEHDRMKAAHAKEIATDFELKSAQYRLESQHAKHNAMIQRKPILDAKIAGLEAEVKAAQRDLKLRIEEQRALDEAKVRVQKATAMLATSAAQLRNALLRQSRMEIRAAKGGVVMRRMKSPGEKLSIQSDNPDSAKVLSLYNPKKLQVRVDVALTEAARVQVGQRAEIVVDVEGDTVYAGTVTRIVNEADIQKNTLEIKVAIEKPSRAIRPSMYARVKFYTRPARPAPGATPGETPSSAGGSGMYALYVPKALVRDESGKASVWVATGGVAKKVAVTLGRRTRGEWVEVTDGLRDGDRLIAGEIPDLRDGEKITVIGESKDYN